MKSFNSFSVVLLKPFNFFDLYSFLISQKIYLLICTSKNHQLQFLGIKKFFRTDNSNEI